MDGVHHGTPQRWPELREDFEVEASMIRSYECMVIPGLLQTPEYSKAVFLGAGAYSKSEVQRHVDARMQRQHILGRHKPPRLWGSHR